MGIECPQDEIKWKAETTTHSMQIQDIIFHRRTVETKVHSILVTYYTRPFTLLASNNAKWHDQDTFFSIMNTNLPSESDANNRIHDKSSYMNMKLMSVITLLRPYYIVSCNNSITIIHTKPLQIDYFMFFGFFH